jgi:hypothetical protein
VTTPLETAAIVGSLVVQVTAVLTGRPSLVAAAAVSVAVAPDWSDRGADGVMVMVAGVLSTGEVPPESPPQERTTPQQVATARRRNPLRGREGRRSVLPFADTSAGVPGGGPPISAAARQSARDV